MAWPMQQHQQLQHLLPAAPQIGNFPMAAGGVSRFTAGGASFGLPLGSPAVALRAVVEPMVSRTPIWTAPAVGGRAENRSPPPRGIVRMASDPPLGGRAAAGTVALAAAVATSTAPGCRSTLHHAAAP
eukprot:CAMPEP_0177227920 /NCGR_PEP_ID=MMETSP0367-20130122/40871_1 /TAXON_ID=447022 ORGANISM="Scrippsiella hangoei-like, Strain SHHI-4" /NCGR_SAMPLE_ID=MMETSP0367 /ASSEMBLY_ACC=CAM_ASM_000362 /LENGTH=127 /DNA_ID=CAMNT_0018678181 /DNA_START=1 /DNA_END=380 /DNA_ORIENTATION=-